MSAIPVTDDIDTRGWFEAAANGKLVVRQCSNCDAVLHMPRAYCRTCGSFEGHWREVAPTGSIYSYLVQAHQVHPDFPVPHTIILVELDELPGVRFVGCLDGRPEVHIGQPVKAGFSRLADDVVIPDWTLV